MLPFFPPRIPGIIERGPKFIQSLQNLTIRTPQTLTPTNVHPELSEMETTMEALKENNRDIKKILGSLMIPRTDVRMLEKTLSLRFEEVVSEIEIILLPPDL